MKKYLIYFLIFIVPIPFYIGAYIALIDHGIAMFLFFQFVALMVHGFIIVMVFDIGIGRCDKN